MEAYTTKGKVWRGYRSVTQTKRQNPDSAACHPTNTYFILVYDRIHLFGLGYDTETETENWPKLLADTETNRNHKILNWKALHQGVCKKFSCHVNYQNIYSVYQ